MRWIVAALVCALPLRAVAQQPDRVQDPYGALEDMPPPQTPQAPQWVPPPAPPAPYVAPLPPPAPYSAPQPYPPQPYPPQPYSPQPYAGQPYCPQACAPCPQACAPCPQACAPYPQPCAQACPPRLAGYELPPSRPGEWRMRMDADGSFWREREVRKSNRGLLGAGLGVWLGTWFITFLSSSTTAHDGSGAATIFPMIGPFIAAGISKDPGPAVGYTVSGLLQIAGFAMFVAGAASKHLVTERQRAHYDPLTGSLRF
jgi:hypothetical protein